MKIILKEKILSIISSMEEANNYFKKLTDKASADELFLTCQETAAQIGDIIEKNESQPGKVIEYLENYCELVYQLYICEGTEWGALVDKLEMQVEKIRSGIEKVIPSDSMKAVFLPYIASMWDTFHSIYLSAKEDLRFDVKVVPIPYYTLGPEGQILSEHYEGQEISEYAKITDYRNYDFQREQPDIIFIHNPYDQYNRVTRIPEAFYSSQLIKYTSRLVYIPYYISKEKTLDHFMQLPGVRNAWRIFAQNETIREQYIESGIASEKVVALGSPKLDMVVSFSKKKQPIPDEWSALKNKKVFFYNTSLMDIMNRGDLFLKKIRYVISVFKEHKDMALLWRPHPLSIATIQATAPELLNDYLNLIQDFKNSGIGVYDDTGELDRTIAISDAYIGELQSSVSQLYEATGKPMYYIENYNPDFMLEERYARCLCAEVIDKKIYMYSWEYNSIFVYDEITKTVRVERGDDTALGCEKFLYLQSIEDGNIIYFVPSAALNVIKYNISDGNRKLISIRNEGKAFDPVIFGGKLYLLPIYYSDYFASIDLETEQVEYIGTHYREQFPNIKNLGEKSLFYGNTVLGHSVWRISFIGAFLQRICLDSNEIQYIELKNLKEPLRGIAFDGKYFWGAGLYGNKIYKWDPNENKIICTIAIERWEQLQKTMLFSDIYFFGNSIWVFFKRECNVVRIDPTTENIKILDFSNIFELRFDGNEQQLFSENIRMFEKYIYLFPYHANGIIKIDIETNEVYFEKIHIESQQLLKKISGSILSESICSLKKFLQRVKQSKNSACKNGYILAGDRIWKYISDNLYM